jgi:outer membrane protein assembly factor BamD (BamD/ComL family)
MTYDRRYGAPLPSTLEDALEEIESLRRRLYLSNQRWASAAEKCQQVQRSFSGTVKRMEKASARSEAQWASFRDSAARITGSQDPQRWLELLQQSVP